MKMKINGVKNINGKNKRQRQRRVMAAYQLRGAARAINAAYRSAIWARSHRAATAFGGSARVGAAS